jgi:hypothetical protein
LFAAGNENSVQVLTELKKSNELEMQIVPSEDVNKVVIVPHQTHPVPLENGYQEPPEGLGHPTEYRTVVKRFFVLGIFILYSAANAFQWIEFAIISNVITQYYGVDRLAVEWTSMIFMVSYIPLIIPAAWFLDRYVSHNSLSKKLQTVSHFIV